MKHLKKWKIDIFGKYYVEKLGKIVDALDSIGKSGLKTKGTEERRLDKDENKTFL